MHQSFTEKIPKQPVLSRASFRKQENSPLPCVLDAGEVRYVNRGSLALALALQHMKLAPNDEVLIPAYHCIAMVEPVLWNGGKPRFYRIHEDTSLDLSDLETRVNQFSRAMIAPHYFGFHQNMKVIRQFCDRHQLILIEDCAHAFFGSHAGHPLGYYGDYAIGSAWKFFPIDEGACLVSSKRDLSDVATAHGGLFSEFKSFSNTVEYALEYNRLGAVNPALRGLMRMKDRLWSVIKPGTAQQPIHDLDNAAAGGMTGFDGNRVRKSCSTWSRWVIGSVSRMRIVRNRRENYKKLLAGLGGLPGCHPLFDGLPEEVVPHVFPLVMDAPEAVFSRLKSIGVPVIRFGEYLWSGMEKGLCRVSEDYSRRIFQFPCHQDLNDAELAWMIAQIRELMLVSSSMPMTAGTAA
jgi:dTDP-4-amino-4,6-dideoxygalactose transaminase